MAKIQASVKEKVFKINRWLGVNESPDGDTGLRMGEASVMQNFELLTTTHYRRGSAVRTLRVCLTVIPLLLAAHQTTLTELNHTTASFPVHDNVNVSDTGLLSVSGTTATANYGNANTYKNYYRKDNEGKIWKFDTCIYTPRNHWHDCQWRFCKHR